MVKTQLFLIHITSKYQRQSVLNLFIKRKTDVCQGTLKIQFQHQQCCLYTPKIFLNLTLVGFGPWL